MAAVARKTTDAAGGLIATGRLSVVVNNAPIATRGDAVLPHPPSGKHARSLIIGYTDSVVAENSFVARQGDATSCSHVISTGSGDVEAGN